MMRSIAFSIVVMSFASLVVTVPAFAEKFEVEQDKEGVVIQLDGEMFTHYLIKSGAKPVLFPVIGPDGVHMTRSYPIGKAEDGEKQDHPHHRSFWFTHGDVNGVSFWHETEGHGTIVHRKFVEVDGGETARIVSENDWMMPVEDSTADEAKEGGNDDVAGKVICSDVRTLEFGADDKNRWIDFDIKITAGEKPVVFGDTKEGTFGIRTAGTMKVDAGLGGTIVNSEGLTDKETWGKPAAWVDYSGPVGKSKETFGIAIFNHPSSYGYPTHWHVRTYGLFAANPFGLHDFYGKDSGKTGKVELAPGESLKFRYRVLLHKGNEKEANVAELFSEYSAE